MRVKERHAAEQKAAEARVPEILIVEEPLQRFEGIDARLDVDDSRGVTRSGRARRGSASSPTMVAIS